MIFLSKVPAVRVQAVSALEFLQEPDAQCPVTSALIDLLRKDSSPEVRQCALSKIAVTDRTLPGDFSLLIRCCQPSDSTL